MAIADFHNDVLTSASFNNSEINFGDNKVVTALFKGDRCFADVVKLARYSKYIAFEDVGYLDLDIDKLIELKPIYVGLTWNGENQFGYGCDYSFGLKRKGVELIKILNENGIAVDTAHLSKRGFIDVLDSAEKVVNSHTCFQGVFKHKRNLDDWQIDALVKRRAPIGIACCGYFMTNRKTCKITDYISNILYFYEKYGSECICIGSDFNGTDFLPENLTSYECFVAVENELEKRGIDKHDIQKFSYKNLDEFLSASK